MPRGSGEIKVRIKSSPLAKTILFTSVKPLIAINTCTDKSGDNRTPQDPRIGVPYPPDIAGSCLLRPHRNRAAPPLSFYTPYRLPHDRIRIEFSDSIPHDTESTESHREFSPPTLLSSYSPPHTHWGQTPFLTISIGYPYFHSVV
jgi:hypothetical protein